MAVDQVLGSLFEVGIAVSIAATVMSLGMTFTVGQLLEPLHRITLVVAVVCSTRSSSPLLLGLWRIYHRWRSNMCRVWCCPWSARAVRRH